MAAAKHSRDADGILVGLGAAVGEEESIDITGRDLRQLYTQSRAHLRGHKRIGIWKHGGLFLDRAHDSLVAVADVDAHQLAVEVDETFPPRRPEVNALRARHRYGIHRGLGRPLEERVPAAEFNDLLAAHCFSSCS